MTEFINGRELSRIYYRQAVRPILETHLPEIPHTAGHFGNGSDVMGFDTPQSRDHDWGPGVYLLLRPSDKSQASYIQQLMQEHLPPQLHGYPTRREDTSDAQVTHRVVVSTIKGYLWQMLHWQKNQPLTVADWLSFPSQLLRIVQDGTVHHDDLGWHAVRQHLRWYPYDVWLYLMAAAWRRIGQEDHLHGRAGQVGDDIGSRLIAARLVRDVMYLCFLQEQRYAPYAKWFGSAFQQLGCATDLTPILHEAQTAEDWQTREAALVQAFEYVARRHNYLGVTAPVEVTAQPFFERPFQVMTHNGHVEALRAAINDENVLNMFDLPGIIGSIDQFSDSTDLKSRIAWRDKIRRLYQPE
jgi:hypothetical protein